MYLVELNPGKEATYGTLTDFTDAIRRGEIGWQARIYHQAKSMWIPVTLHPHFRKFAGKGPADPRWAPRAQWTFLPAEPAKEIPLSAPAKTTPGADGPMAGSEASLTKVTKPRNWPRVLGGLFRPRQG